MKFKAIEEEQWRSAHGLVEDADFIRVKARRTVELLKREFENPSLVDDVGLVFVLPEQGTDVEIQTPVCEARMRLHLVFGEGDGAGVLGRYIVQRKTRSMDDKAIWEPVWSIGIPKRGEPFLGDDAERTVQIGSAFGDRAGMAAFTIGMSILYALANGPQMAEG